jgi:CheY-like chemotaxis protein
MFLKALRETPDRINPSTVRTVTHTVDFLTPLFENFGRVAPPLAMPPGVLVVDDESKLTLMICEALQQGGLRAIALENSSQALSLLTLNSFDLVFLDIAMPGMDGFELCSKLRELPNHKQTPVVFLTGLTDIGNRAKSILRGGNDLISKPFLASELIVKALTYIYQSQLRPP